MAKCGVRVAKWVVWAARGPRGGDGGASTGDVFSCVASCGRCGVAKGADRVFYLVRGGAVWGLRGGGARGVSGRCLWKVFVVGSGCYRGVRSC